MTSLEVSYIVKSKQSSDVSDLWKQERIVTTSRIAIAFGCLALWLLLVQRSLRYILVVHQATVRIHLAQ